MLGVLCFRRDSRLHAAWIRAGMAAAIGPRQEDTSMAGTTESSVMFALSELQRIEGERIAEEAALEA